MWPPCGRWTPVLLPQVTTVTSIVTHAPCVLRSDLDCALLGWGDRPPGRLFPSPIQAIAGAQSYAQPRGLRPVTPPVTHVIPRLHEPPTAKRGPQARLDINMPKPTMPKLASQREPYRNYRLVDSCTPTFANRLSSARNRNFVGRAREQQLWAATLAVDLAPCPLLWIVGPAGVGKTALASRLSELAADGGRLVVQLDARELETTSSEAFLAQFLVGIAQAKHSASRISQRPSQTVSLEEIVRAAIEDVPGVLIIDAAEALGPLERWLREALLPALPATWCVVVAGRNAPSPSWQTDAGWRDVMRVHPLPNLDLDDSSSYLEGRGVPSECHRAIFLATHGHPLALSVAASVMLQGVHTEPHLALHDPSAVAALLHCFGHAVPELQYRKALQIAAHARVVNETILRHVFATDDVSHLYEWLSSLSSTTAGPEGLHLHDLAAHAIACESRRRDPSSYLRTHHKLVSYYVDRLQAASDAARNQAAVDLCFLHRHSATLGRLLDWTHTLALDAAPLQPDEYAALVAATRRVQGREASIAVEFWIGRQPEAFTILRERSGEVRGYVCALLLTQAEADSREVQAADHRLSPIATTIRSHGPLRDHEQILVLHALDYEAGSDPSAVLVPMLVTALQHLRRMPRLAWTFAIGQEPIGQWDPVLRHLEHFPGPSIAVGDRVCWAYGHDWRARPAQDVFEAMAEREALAEHAIPMHPPTASALVLSREAFAKAVRSALRSYTDPYALQGNPLMQCRVAKHMRRSPGDAPLQRVIELALGQLEHSEKDSQLYTAVKLTYCDPGRTQQETAELLDMPFSTYRRHLSVGIERMTHWLWQREVDGDAVGGEHAAAEA